MGGALDINVLAVTKIMDLKRMSIEEQDENLEKVQRIARIVIGEQRRANEAKREAGK